MRILNYTPHKIDIVGFDPIPSDGEARVSESITIVDTINGINVISKNLGVVVGLPEESDDIVYIVSLMVSQALPNRKDLLIPGELIRDKGVVVGCKNLCRL